MLQFDVNIAKYLETYELGEYSGSGDWGIYAGIMPEKPDNCIAVFDTGGNPLQNLVEFTGNTFKFHIMVRGKDDAATLLKANEIYDLLKFDRMVNANGFIFENIMAETNILPGGRDKNNRMLKAMNFRGLYNNQ